MASTLQLVEQISVHIAILAKAGRRELALISFQSLTGFVIRDPRTQAAAVPR
jgi:hypothetical protein